jgi:hypothetical protein
MVWDVGAAGPETWINQRGLVLLVRSSCNRTPAIATVRVVCAHGRSASLKLLVGTSLA